jgi:hypothetical protein
LCHNCSKINRRSTTWKSAGNFNNSSKRIQTFFRRLWMMMNFGFRSTTLKLSSNRRSERVLLHLGLKTSRSQEQNEMHFAEFYILKNCFLGVRLS